MNNVDLSVAYDIALETFLNAKYKIPNNQYDAMMSLEHHVSLDADHGKTAWLTGCYDMTMTYLLAKQDVEDKHHDGEMSHDERQELMASVEKIKNQAALFFNRMQDNGFYFGQDNMQHFTNFWNAFYNHQPCDMHQLAQFLERNLQEAREVLEKRNDIKMSSQELGDACFKFASTSEFVKMARLALTVENKHIHELGDYIANIERLVDDVREKHAVESSTIDKGFVTHYAFALDKDKDVRASHVSAVERCILSTPGISNKVAQEFIHVKVGKTYCTAAQQRAYGGNKNYEDFVDSIRNIYASATTSTKVIGNVAKVLTIATQAATDPTLSNTMQEMMSEFEEQLRKHMPQTVLGKSKDQIKIRDLPLDLLILDAKLEQGDITEAEKAERFILKRAFDSAVEAARETAETVITKNMQAGGALSKEVMGNVASGVQEFSMDIFDNFRYDDLRGADKCDGERGMATLRLITHMMSYGQQERENNPLSYYEAMSFLEDRFENGIREMREAGVIPWPENSEISQDRER